MSSSQQSIGNTRSDVPPDISDLQMVTDTIRDRMQSVGWFLMGSRERRYDLPTAWDINDGWCSEWAYEAVKRFGGEVVWLDQLTAEFEDVSHAVLMIGEHFYDAQNLEGVQNPRELDVVKQVSREEWLSRQIAIA